LSSFRQDLQDDQDYFLDHFPDESDPTQPASGGKMIFSIKIPISFQYFYNAHLLAENL